MLTIISKIFNPLKKIIKMYLSSAPYLKPLALVFFLISILTRLGLLFFNQDFSLLAPQYSLGIFSLGVLFDASAFIYWVIPYILLLSICPRAFKKYLAYILAFILIVNWSLIAASEFTFWHEFSSRFNFIAVDYLIYTSEVLGNIRESYNLPLLLSTVVAVTLLFFFIYFKLTRREDNQYQAHPAHQLHQAQKEIKVKIEKQKTLVAAPSLPKKISIQIIRVLSVVLLLPALNYLTVQASWANFSENREANELALNGPFAFGHAFFANQIDYQQFYPQISQAIAKHILQKYFANIGEKPWQRNALSELDVPLNLNASTEKTQPNIVLISIESMSADFLRAYGNTENITPFLDSIKDQSIWFKKLYATGTRTVRGLEALSMSIPPTPGHSIVKRNDNKGLATLGDVLGRNGYQSSFIYGGYSAFDNMGPYFKNSGYEIIDRGELQSNQIHYENIWGVADEDLFTLALQTFDKQSRQNPASKTAPFFAHIMTTSNHRPFTYPEGRIDIPSKTNRQGAVKYTDWAIGDFFKRAAQKPWFKNTVFVIVADHCASARGKTDLPIDKFLIPLFIYAPALDLQKYPQFKPRVIEKVASQIDIAPTILALNQQNLPIKFFGQNILSPKFSERAFMANYQTVGMLENNQMVELRPKQAWRLLDANNNQLLKQGTIRSETDLNNTPDIVKKAIAYYQSASLAYKNKELLAN